MHRDLPRLARTWREASPGARWYLALCLVIGIGCARIVATYGVFTQTVDEPAHIACGIELLEDGRYTFEPQHPPLARMFVALGPWLDGSRRDRQAREMYAVGRSVLYAGDYWRTLALARLGILPFFILACLIVWAWTKRLSGPATALVAVALFTNLPPILGHAGLATTDLALTATLGAALYALTRYLEAPTWGRAVILGTAGAAALASKFSSVPFFLAALAALLASRALWNRRHGLRAPRVSPLQCAACLALVFVGAWSVYRFSWDPIVVPAIDLHDPTFSRQLDALPSAVRDRALELLTTPLPGGRIVRGIGSVYLHNAMGHKSFLLGEFGDRGWWYYFPVVLAVKTPLPFLVLALGGAFLQIRRAWRTGASGCELAPVVMAAAILAAAMPSNINVGVRHVLILYLLLAIPAAHAAVEGWLRGGIARLAAAALLAWMAVSVALAHPDYLAYFNETAGSRPERIVVDSDLDWGQDLHRLGIRLQELDARSVALSYFGSARVDRAGLPPTQELVSCDQPVEWAAISLFNLNRLERRSAGDPDAARLHACLTARPAERVGKSILLYRFQPAAGR